MQRHLFALFLAATTLMWSCVDLTQQARCASDDDCRYGRVCGEGGFCEAGADVEPPGEPDTDTEPDADPQPLTGLVASPEEVIFDRVQDGDPTWRRAWQTLEIRNAGSTTLDIDQIALEGDPAFELDYPDSMWPDRLDPGESFELRVWYGTQTNEPVSARVIVRSSDLRGDFEVPLWADPNPPCVEVDPVDHLIFGVDGPTERLTKYVNLTNCADESTLAIREVRLEVDAGGGFFVPQDALPGRLPEHSALIAPGDTAAIPVVYTGSSFAWNEGELVIETNVAEQRVIRILLLRETTENDCPIARAGARTSDGVPFIASLRAETGSTVELSARNSVDPDGEVVEYRWTIVSRPDGSRSELAPSREERDVRLSLDKNGQYLVELQVWDDAGALNCGGAARVTVIAE